MTDFSPLSSTVRFEDLLKANKQQFDQIFAAQTRELGLLGSTRSPPTSADLESASLAAVGAAGPSDVYRMLNERFGAVWSSEVIEHKSERGSVTVLCKLTVDGVAKMQFGSARANGDEGAALERATAAALRSCADMFGETLLPVAEAERARAPRRPHDAAPAPAVVPAPRRAAGLTPYRST